MSFNAIRENKILAKISKYKNNLQDWNESLQLIVLCFGCSNESMSGVLNVFLYVLEVIKHFSYLTKLSIKSKLCIKGKLVKNKNRL